MATDLDERQVTPDADSNDPGQQYADREFNSLVNPTHYSKDATPGELSGGEQSSLFNPNGDNEAATAPEIAAQEKTGTTTNTPKDVAATGTDTESENLYSGADKKQPFWSSFRLNRRKGIVGSIILLLTGGGLFGASIASGPFHFLKISQAEQQAHYANQESAGDNSMREIFGDVLRGKRAAQTGAIGETRVGFLLSKYTTTIQADLAKAGIKITTDGFGTATGFTVDTSSSDSPFSGMSDEEARLALEKSTGLSVAYGERAGTFVVSGNGELSAKEEVKLRKVVVKSAVELTNLKTIPTAARWRVLGRFYGATSNLHPIQKLGSYADQALTNWWNSKKAEINGKLSGISVDTTGVRDSEDVTNPDGTVTLGTPDPGGTAGVPSGDKVTSVLKGLSQSKTASAVGGFAAVAGVACALKTVDDNVGIFRYVHLIVPMIALSQTYVSVGDEIKNGQSISAGQLGKMAQNFEEVDKEGKVVSTVDDAASVQAAEGKTGGKDLDNATKSSLKKGKISALSWTQTPAVQAVCSPAGTNITTVASVAIGFAGGAFFETVLGGVASSITTEAAISLFSGLLSSGSIDVAGAAGATLGSYIDYGTLFAANSSAVSDGGTALSASQAAALTNSSSQQYLADFQSKSLASRLFDTHDSRSLLAQAINTQTPDFSHNVASIFGSFTHLGSALLSVPSKIFGNTVHAGPLPYDYAGTPVIGISQQDQDANPDFVQTIDRGGELLDGPDSNTYVTKAMNCFGDAITKGTNGWQVVPQKYVNIYDDTYDSYNCNDRSADWITFRLFIHDSLALDGYACFKGDDQACADLAFTANPTSTITPGATGSPVTVTGTAAQLAQQLLDAEKGSDPHFLPIGCVAGSTDQCNSGVNQDLKATAAGKTINNSDTCGNTVSVDASLLQVLLTATQKYKIQPINIITGHGCDSFLHPKGRASDIDFVTDLSTGITTNLTPGSSGDNQTLDGQFFLYIASILPPGGELGQDECSGRSGLRATPGITYFSDSCNHQHIDLGEAKPSAAQL